MSTMSGGPNIVTNGLVLHLDASNVKSFRGEPTTNLVASPKSVTTGYATTIPTRTDNQLLNFDGTFTAGLLSGTGWIAYTSASTTNGNRYTTSWYVKAGTITSVTFQWGGAHQGNRTNFTFNLSTGAVSSLTLASGENYGVDSFGNGWWRVWYSSTLSTGNAYYPELSIGNGTIYLGGLQIEQKSYSTPFVVGTRGTTVATGGGWADRTINGFNGELVNGPTYNSANGGSILFDGVNDYVSLSNTIILGNTFTILSWIKVSTLASGDYIVYGTDANGADNWFAVNGSAVSLYFTQTADTNNRTISGGVINSTDVWYNIGCTINQNVAKIYLNGVEQNSLTVEFTIGSWDTSVNSIGRRGSLAQRYFQGNIAIVQAYNRVLSASEILQNYNAQKSRFGLS